MMRHRLIEVRIFSRKQGYESKSSKFVMMRHRMIEVGIIIYENKDLGHSFEIGADMELIFGILF